MKTNDPRITLIAAGVEDALGDFVIARDNELPFKCEEDMSRFKALTIDHIVIMGRRTYESIGKPLPNRRNMVISSNPDLQLPAGVELCPSLDAAVSLAKLDAAETGKSIFIIGGGKVYAEAIGKQIPDMIDLTLVDSKVLRPDSGDVVISARHLKFHYWRGLLDAKDYGYITQWYRRNEESPKD